MTVSIKKINIENVEQKVFYFLAFVLITSVFMYVVFVNQTILNVIARKNIEKDISFIESTISELEFQYISQKKNIDQKLAYSLGFVDIDNIKYLTRGEHKTLSLLNLNEQQ